MFKRSPSFSCLLILLAVAILAACRPAPGGMPPKTKPPRGTAPKAAQTQLPSRSGVATTPTILPGSGAAAPAGAQNTTGETAFHVNFLIDESVSCTGTCDSFSIPRLVLYFRGSMAPNASGSLRGNGTMRFIGADPCETLMPNVSSCQLDGVSDGSFTAEGEALPGGKLRLTLHLQQAPVLSGAMVTRHPVQGNITLPFDATYSQELKSLFENAKIFETPYEVQGGIGSNAAVNWEGTYELKASDGATVRRMHGFGGLFFISPETALPEPALPSAASQ